MADLKIILFLHLFSTLAMFGIIWFVQIVHYPLFAQVGAEQFPHYEALHSRLTTFVVAPLMLIELFTGLYLLMRYPEVFIIWGMILILGIWLSTFFLQVPFHGQLSNGFNIKAHEMLVKTNWIRTILWSLRGVIVLLMINRL